MDYQRSGEDQYLAHRMEDIRDLDIGILVNNVGVDVLDYYHKVP